MKICAIIILSVFSSISFAVRTTDNLKVSNDTLLNIEYKIYLSTNNNVKDSLIILKSEYYKVKKKHLKAIKELERVEQNSGYYTRACFEKALNSVLIHDYNHSYNCLLEIPDSVIIRNRSYLLLWLITLVETGRYEVCKSILLNIVDSSTVNSVLSLPENYDYRNPSTAMTLSSIFPGIGQVYSGYPTKGFVSFLLNAGFLTVTIGCIITGLYITAAVIGFVPLLKFYFGGRQLSQNLASDFNTNSLSNFKKEYLNIIFEFYNHSNI